MGAFWWLAVGCLALLARVWLVPLLEKQGARKQGVGTLVTGLNQPDQAAEGKAVGRFSPQAIERQVTFEGAVFNVRLEDIDWLVCGNSTHAKVIISKSFAWSVGRPIRTMLTHGDKPTDCTDEVMGAFANAGLIAKRALVNACLSSVQAQILEIERQIKKG